jgi:cytochrome c-type biogenesis protein CcmE
VPRRRNPARLVVALSVAAVLAIFLVYTSFAGGSTRWVSPGELEKYNGKVTLAGRVVGTPSGNARGKGLRFTLRDVEGNATVPVVYRGSVPDPFRTGRDVYLKGTLANGIFVAERDSLVTRCPSKYSPKSETS